MPPLFHETATRPIVFVGPSIPLGEATRILDADYRPPCRRGDLEQVPDAATVAIIDGVFHQQEAISPREIVCALRRGVQVFGSSSMGALRAAEVPGMYGVGAVYEMYSTGTIDGDDEVALVFDPERLVPLTVPLVNVRHAVARVHQSGTISLEVASRILTAALDLHYKERTYRRILQVAGLSHTVDADDLCALLASVDLKKEDAQLLLERLFEATSGDGTSITVSRSGPLSTSSEHHAPECSRGVQPLRGGSADRSLLVWEMGDTVTGHELIAFLKLTGKFETYAREALIVLLLTNRLADTRVDVSTAGPVTREFRNLCRIWGWTTPEEIRLTMTDLGLGLKDVIRHFRGKQLAASVLSSLSRNGNDALWQALRCELFCNDLTLKREVMRCASLKSLARALRSSPADIEAAKSVLCRLNMTDNWDRLSAKFAMLGVPRHTVRRFLRMVAAARRTATAVRPLVSKRRRRYDADETFGLGASPKPDGERRFAVSMADAYASAQLLRSVIGVTRVGMIHGLTELQGVYVSQAARPTGAWSSTYGSGKSETREGAIVGAIMEETEKWAQERFSGEPLYSSYVALRTKARTLDPALLDLPYDSGYTPNVELPWQRCVDLITGGTRWVPLAAVACPSNAGRNNIYYSRRASRVVFSTNGLASGFTLAEALVHAICECIERHAVKQTDLLVDNPGALPCYKWPKPVELTTLTPRTRNILEQIGQFGAVSAWNITSEIGVPTLLARIVIEGKTAIGSATHPNRDVATEMAVLEACQSVAGSIAGGREDLALQVRSLGRHERPRPLRPIAQMYWQDRDVRRVSSSNLGGVQLDDIYEEFKWIRERLLEAGVKHLIAVDLTQPDILPVRVVRVILPGLETNNPFRLGPRGRVALISDFVHTRVSPQEDKRHDAPPRTMARRAL